ncbi:MAG: glycosyltransferase family 4 protein [Candidatus Methanofastidiosia archaeon]
MTKILVHTSPRGFRIEEPLMNAGYSVVKIPDNQHKSLKLLNLMRVIAQENPRIILVDSAGLMLISAFFLSKLFRIPLIVRMRADIWVIYREQKEYNNLFIRVYEWVLLISCEAILRRAARIFSVSEYLKGVMKEKGIQAEKIRVMPFPIDCTRFHPEKKEDHNITLLSVANLTFKRKTEGLLEILPVIHEVISKHQNIRYLIAGGGRFSELLKESLLTLKNEHIVYLGFQNEIENLFSRADIFIHYSYLDAYPSVVLEAMASGLPVIANRFGGMTEQVESETGALVEDTHAFRRALEQLIENKDMRVAMGKKGRSNVSERFSMNRIKECYAGEIDEILTNKYV